MKCIELIKKALLRGGDNYTIHDVARTLHHGETQIFTSGDSCVITEIVVHPQRKELSVWIAAGTWDELTALEEQVKDFARQHGCERIVAHAHRAFTRKLESLGFRETTRNFVMEL